MSIRFQSQRDSRSFESTYPLHDGAGLVRIVLALADRLARPRGSQAVAGAQVAASAHSDAPTSALDRADLQDRRDLRSATLSKCATTVQVLVLIGFGLAALALSLLPQPATRNAVQQQTAQHMHSQQPALKSQP